MNRHVTIPTCEKFAAMHLYPHQLDEQVMRMERSSSNGNLNRHLSIASYNLIDKNQIFYSNPTSLSTINRHLSMSSYDQFYEEEQPLRIHVGNIPFLWTIDDLRKQFLVFGPVKDPEIVSNERGSKGFGFITFLHHSDGMNAIRVKNGSIADGRKITVALASSRSSSRINSHHCCYCSKNFI
ncbi:unnamed protein product [Rotaria sordida]|uniref:RRM domain-containing protein n=1 Tax=Rotaria sordida TaxID=392033 RepID=A0A815DMP1_9BILA|nr:unnamed protein product [Rotaria sordida]CAF1299013.1 unnamed protein product [Rotaria sordida]CAF3641923.1 unnamed protein product [Rotaria sordida]CAF3680931.1 unnamed protein product [Rotaria sordida]